ncbi:MAG: hypothetical protein AABW68_03035 [archaeon]
MDESFPDKRKKKHLSEYFPEGRIIVTAGIVLMVATIAASLSTFSTIGFAPAFVMGMPPSLGGANPFWGWVLITGFLTLLVVVAFHRVKK